MRNEDIWDESDIAASFKDGRQVDVSCPAIIFVPGKVVVALALTSDQDIEEQCPHVTLLTNDMKDRNQIMRLVQLACTRSGCFTSLYNNLKTGGKLKENKRFVSGGVVLDRSKAPVTCHFIAL